MEFIRSLGGADDIIPRWTRSAYEGLYYGDVNGYLYYTKLSCILSQELSIYSVRMSRLIDGHVHCPWGSTLQNGPREIFCATASSQY